MTPETEAKLRRDVEASKRKNIAVLNRLESHLGCVICRDPLTDGRCPRCQSDPLPSEQATEAAPDPIGPDG